MQDKNKTGGLRYIFFVLLASAIIAIFLSFNDRKQNNSDSMNESVSFLVAKHRHAQLAAALKKNPSGVEDNSFDGRSALRIAAEDGCISCLSLLINAGADINQRTGAGEYKGFQPIHFATINGRLEAIKMLASAGASINSSDASGSTPLFLAVKCNREGLVGHLLKMGADPCCSDNFGWQPLHWAALKGLSDAVQYLVEAKAPINKEVLAIIFMEKFPVPKRKHIGSLTVQCFPSSDPTRKPEIISLSLYNWTDAPEKILPAEWAEMEHTPRLYNPVQLSRLLSKDSITAYLKANGGKD